MDAPAGSTLSALSALLASLSSGAADDIEAPLAHLHTALVHAPDAALPLCASFAPRVLAAATGVLTRHSGVRRYRALLAAGVLGVQAGGARLLDAAPRDALFCELARVAADASAAPVSVGIALSLLASFAFSPLGLATLGAYVRAAEAPLATWAHDVPPAASELVDDAVAEAPPDTAVEAALWLLLRTVDQSDHAFLLRTLWDAAGGLASAGAGAGAGAFVPPPPSWPLSILRLLLHPTHPTGRLFLCAPRPPPALNERSTALDALLPVAAAAASGDGTPLPRDSGRERCRGRGVGDGAALRAGAAALATPGSASFCVLLLLLSSPREGEVLQGLAAAFALLRIGGRALLEPVREPSQAALPGAYPEHFRAHPQPRWDAARWHEHIISYAATCTSVFGSSPEGDDIARGAAHAVAVHLVDDSSIDGSTDPPTLFELLLRLLSHTAAIRSSVVVRCAYCRTLRAAVDLCAEALGAPADDAWSCAPIPSSGVMRAHTLALELFVRLTAFATWLPEASRGAGAGAGAMSGIGMDAGAGAGAGAGLGAVPFVPFVYDDEQMTSPSIQPSVAAPTPFSSVGAEVDPSPSVRAEAYACALYAHRRLSPPRTRADACAKLFSRFIRLERRLLLMGVGAGVTYTAMGGAGGGGLASPSLKRKAGALEGGGDSPPAPALAPLHSILRLLVDARLPPSAPPPAKWLSLGIDARSIPLHAPELARGPPAWEFGSAGGAPPPLPGLFSLRDITPDAAGNCPALDAVLGCALAAMGEGGGGGGGANAAAREVVEGLIEGIEGALAPFDVRARLSQLRGAVRR